MIQRFRLSAALCGAALMLAGPAPAQTADAGQDAASTAAFKASMDKMHKAMTIAYTGNTDLDFVRGMLPHHQGAVDMARIELEHGTDPELRKLAEEIIAAQDREIAFMQAWLERNAPDAAQADAAKMESLTANPATGAAPEPRPGTDAPPPQPRPGDAASAAPPADKPAN